MYIFLDKHKHKKGLCKEITITSFLPVEVQCSFPAISNPSMAPMRICQNLEKDKQLENPQSILTAFFPKSQKNDNVQPKRSLRNHNVETHDDGTVRGWKMLLYEVRLNHLPAMSSSFMLRRWGPMFFIQGNYCSVQEQRPCWTQRGKSSHKSQLLKNRQIAATDMKHDLSVALSQYTQSRNGKEIMRVWILIEV